LKSLAPQVGLEPTTLRLTAEGSHDPTTELGFLCEFARAILSSRDS
jgi:hypothetical protein